MKKQAEKHEKLRIKEEERLKREKFKQERQAEVEQKKLEKEKRIGVIDSIKKAKVELQERKDILKIVKTSMLGLKNSLGDSKAFDGSISELQKVLLDYLNKQK